MSTSLIIVGPDLTPAQVDAFNQLKVALNPDPAKAGAVKLFDAVGNPLLTTENGALATSLDQILFWDQIDGSALNTNRWTNALSGMTLTQAGGFINLNAGLAVTANAYAILQSIKSIPFYGYLPLKVDIVANMAAASQVNTVTEIGIGAVATNALPTDGAFFRYGASGDLRCVISNNGIETSSPAIAQPATADQVLYTIIVVEDLVRFYLDDELAAEVQIPITQAFPTSAGRLPVFCRVYNGSSAPQTAPKLQVGQVIVTQQAANQNRVWRETLVAMGNHAVQGPTSYAPIANFANSGNPANATLSNTAAGYTTLGGRFAFVPVTGAATDYALFAYQIPAGYQFFLTGCWVSSLVSTALGLTASVLEWSLGVNASAVSLATADSPPATWAPRRVGLGLQSFPISSLAGAGAADISRNFDPPLVVDGGRFLHVILQIPIGTTTGLIRGQVALNGYFE